MLYLQHLGREVGQARTLAARQGHVTAVRPSLETVDHIGQAAGAFGQVRRVDLRDVTQAEDLGARAGARDQGLELLRRQVLRLVDDDEAVQEGAAAHEVERLDLDARTDKVLRRRTAPVAGFVVGLVQHVEVVFQRAHPRRHFFLFGARQKTDVFAHRHGDAGHDDLGVGFFVEHLGQRSGQRQQGFSGTGLAEQRDEVDLGIHQHVEREILLAVACGNAPDVVLLVAVVLDRDQFGLLALDLEHLGIKRVGAFLIDEFVGQKIRRQRPFEAVVSVAGSLPGFHALAVRIPEIGGQFEHAGIQQVGVFQHLVVGIVFGGQSQGARLDPHVDVFRHQDDLPLGEVSRQEQHHAENLVVDLAGGQGQRDVAGDRLRLQEQLAGGGAMAVRCDRHALFDGVDLAHHFVKETAGLARVARNLGHAFLVLVEFLQRGDRHVDVVLLEAEQTGRIVHQHIGVQHEQLGVGRGFSRHGFSGLSSGGWGVDSSYIRRKSAG